MQEQIGGEARKVCRSQETSLVDTYPQVKDERGYGLLASIEF